VDENPRPRWSAADTVVALALLALLAWLVQAVAVARPLPPPALQLAYAALPRYAAYSWLRMLGAYALSLAFSLVYAYAAVASRTAERFLLPLLDILQSIPVLSFMPVVLLAITGLFPGTRVGINLAVVVLIFTGQAWNLTFSLYTSLRTVPEDLREAAASLRLSAWQRMRVVELPFAVVGLVWNSMMSWAGGWFFLMAAEMFSLGPRQYQVEGLGSYLALAAQRGRWGHELAGLGVLVAVIVLMDQLIWRPLLAWAERFKVETSGGPPARSGILRFLRRSRLLQWVERHGWQPAMDRLDRWSLGALPRLSRQPAVRRLSGGLRSLLTAAGWLAAAYAGQQGWRLLAGLSLHDLGTVALATGATLLRVTAALAVSVAWTVPAGVFIGLHPTWAQRLAPASQIAASVPATALFPGLVAILVHLRGGLEAASVLLMVLGTQWYILFNVIAGASAISTDWREVAQLFGLRGWRAWRLLILPAVAPSLLTGLITAAGGAWNASIVAEYVSFQNRVYTVFGVGSLIARTSQSGRLGQLFLATAVLALTVVAINRGVWRRLYNRVQEPFVLIRR
jgi:NitT/TauT family transport system permease protein